jgi:hypothetical protein
MAENKTEWPIESRDREEETGLKQNNGAIGPEKGNSSRMQTLERAEGPEKSPYKGHWELWVVEEQLRLFLILRH